MCVVRMVVYFLFDIALVYPYWLIVAFPRYILFQFYIVLYTLNGCVNTLKLVYLICRNINF